MTANGGPGLEAPAAAVDWLRIHSEAALLGFLGAAVAQPHRRLWELWQLAGVESAR